MCVCVCRGERTDEVLRVVHGLMNIFFRTVSDAVVGSPLVAVDLTASDDKLLDDRNEGVAISLIDQHCEAFSIDKINATETH